MGLFSPILESVVRINSCCEPTDCTEMSREWQLLEGTCLSSSSPISSKLVMSDSRPSGLEKAEE